MEGASAWAGLQAEWEALWRACPDATEAQSWIWQSLYWRHVAAGRRCFVATARDRHGGLVAAAAFETRRDRRTLVTTLSFAGEHDADYHVILHVPGTPPAVGARLLAAVLATAGARVSFVEWSNLPEGLWTAAAARQAVDLCGPFAGTAERRESATYAIALPAAPAAYWNGFSKKTRDRLKGKMRKLQREQEVEFRVATEAGAVGALLEDLETVDRSRWGGATKFADARQRAFLRELIAAALKEGLLRVFTLHVAGRCVAFNVGFVLGSAVRIPYLAHDAALPGNYSVGLINNLMAIEHCIGAGLKEFDLTRGSEGYKSLLGGVERTNVHYLLWRSEAWRCLAAGNARVVTPLVRNPLTRALRRLARRILSPT